MRAFLGWLAVLLLFGVRPNLLFADPVATAPAKAAPASAPPHPSAVKPVKSAKAAPAAKSKAARKLPRMTIVITPTRIPQPLGEVGTATTVVSGQSMQDQQIRSAYDALREVPGVQVVQNGSPGTATDIFIRGASADQNLILLDGVPVNNSATSEFDLSRITTDGLDRIEVVRGAGGALYGSQAIGGVVNIISAEGSGPPHFSLLSEGGNRATQNQTGTFGGADGPLSYSGSISYFSTTGFRPINDSSDNLAGALRVDYHLNLDTTFHGFARYIRANVSLSGFSIFSGIPLNPNAHQRNEFMLYKGAVDHRFNEHLSATLSAFYVRDDVRVNAYPFAGNPFSESDHIPDETRGSNLDVIYRWNETFRSLAGFEFLDQWVHSQDNFVSFSPPPPVGVGDFGSLTAFNARRQNYAGYVEQEGRFFNGHLILTGGFRVDGYSDFGKEVSPSWSVAMPFQKYGVTLRGSYAEGFRAPTFNELYFPNFGNPELGPEISSEYDGGITKTFGEFASITTNYFSRRVHNEIVAVPCKVGPGCLFGSLAGNVGRVDTQGVEFIPAVHPLRGVTLSGSFTYLDQRHDPPLFSRQPLRVPKYSAAALAQYLHHDLLRNNDFTTLSAAYTFVGDRDDVAPTGGIANNAAYNRVDVGFSYSPGIECGPIHDESLVARVQNLLDRHYSETLGFPSPPINFLAGVKLDFQ